VINMSSERSSDWGSAGRPIVLSTAVKGLNPRHHPALRRLCAAQSSRQCDCAIGDD